jgi:GNAT superfamily N-acetyltransferase
MNIRKATRADAALVADRIAEAFTGLDATAWLVPEPPERHRVLRDNFRIFVDYALDHGEVHIAGDGEGVAVWIFAEKELPPPPDYERRLAAACGTYAERFAVLDALFEAHQPAGPHHHLAFLAVRPDRQRAGIGTALLDHHHAELDRCGLPGYLDASSTGSRDLYARHGYEVWEPFTLPDGTPFWPMYRPPIDRRRPHRPSSRQDGSPRS